MFNKSVDLIVPSLIKPNLADTRNGLNNIVTLDQSREVYRIVDDMIDGLDDVSLDLIFSANENDVERVLSVFAEETYSVMYGGEYRIKETSINYLDRLVNNIEETLRCENLNYFITNVLTNFEVNWHHLEWGSHVQNITKLNVIAPRDHGKSFMFSNAVPCWRMYRYKGENVPRHLIRRNNLNRKGFIITNEMELAEELLETVKNTIEEYDILKERLYPETKDNWSKRSIKCKNGARLGLKSYGGSFRGRHPGWITVDDFLKDNVLYSEVQRKKAIDYFHSVIMNAILPGGAVNVVGTPFHQNDLYGDLKTKKAWRCFEYPAITPHGDVLWRTRYSYKDLIEKKESQGNIIFSREILVVPISNNSTLFPWQILSRCFYGMHEYKLVKNIDSHPVKFKKVVTACDFARSANVGADFSVFGTWGIDDQEQMWLLHIWRAKGRSFREQINALKYINSNFQPDVIVMEANQFQMIMADIAIEEGFTNVHPHTTSGKNKNDFLTGVPGLAIHFEKNRIKLPRGDQYSKDVTDLLTSELGAISWTDEGIQGVGQHDDMAIMTWLATVGARKIGVGFGISHLN